MRADQKLMYELGRANAFRKAKSVSADYIDGDLIGLLDALRMDALAKARRLDKERVKRAGKDGT